MIPIEIIPTVVPKNAGEFADAVAVASPFASSIHLDVGDSVFTNTLSWPYAEDGAFAPFGLALGTCPVEVHLMVKDPLEVGNSLAQAGAQRIIAHVGSV